MADLTDFRKTYPYCTLTSEFLLVEHGQFVVRCMVQQQGQGVASGLSAATTLEAAEDQARDRALALLSQIGVPPLMPSPAIVDPVRQPPIPPAPTPAPPPTATPPTPASPTKEPAPTPPEVVTTVPTPEPVIEPSQPVQPIDAVTSPQPEVVPAASIDVVDATEPPPMPSHPLEDETAAPPLPDVPAAPPTTQTTPPQPSSPPPTLPNGSFDCIELIARTNREIKRLGWTNEQGQTYLIQTYGKRSRSRLDDHELVEFLQYLEAQPSPV